MNKSIYCVSNHEEFDQFVLKGRSAMQMFWAKASNWKRVDRKRG
jgi:hypothetical protein